MKNIVAVFLLLTIVSVVWASTCETRVDKNLDKTTAEKVRYCLMEDENPSDSKPTSHVIATDIYDVKYPQKKTTPSETQPQTIKQYKAGVTTVQYVDRPDYPAFRNATLPHISEIEAHETALESIQTQKTSSKNKSAKTGKKKTKPAKKTPKSQQKPARTDDPTPAAEIEQAKALQNDPLAQNPTDNGTVPADFLDDSVMGPSGFGYNATDPAFQQ